MQKIGKKTLKIAFPIGLGVLLVIYSYSRFSDQQLTEIRSHFQQARYQYVALSIIFSILSHLVRSYRWIFLARPLGFRPKFYNSFLALNCAYLLNLVIPRGGEITRAVLLDKYENIPFQKGFGSIIAERIVDLLFLLGFTAIATIIKVEVLWNYFIDIIPIKKLGTLALIGVLILLLFWLILRFSKGKGVVKINNFLKGIKEGILSITKMDNKWEFLFYSFLIWVLYIAAFYSCIIALEQTSNIDFGSILLAFVAGSFSVAFTNSGFGSYPLFVAGILSLFGIAITSGTAFGWIIWTSNMFSILILGILSFIALPIINRRE